MTTARTHRITATVGLVLLSAGLHAGTGASVSAAASAEFSMLARADVAGVEVRFRGAPLVPNGEVAFLTPGTAQAEFSSASSRGFASAPYPGPFVLSLPGLISGGSGGVVNVPNYPLVVESDTAFDPNPEPVTAGPYRLSASSSAARTESQARLSAGSAGAGALSGTASTAATQKGESLTTEATSLVEGLALPGGVVVAGTKSFARLTAAPGKAPAVETTLVPGTVTIAGRTFGLTEKGLVTGDTTTPLDLKPAEELLRQAGITFRYLPVERTPTAVTGAALDVSFPLNAPGQPPAVLRVLLGGVRVSLISAAGAVTGTAGIGTTTPGSAGGLEQPAAGAPTAPLAAPFDAAALPSDLPPAADTAEPAPVALAAPPPLTAGLARVALPDPSASGLYLLVAGSALLALAGSRLVGLVAVRQVLPRFIP